MYVYVWYFAACETFPGSIHPINLRSVLVVWLRGGPVKEKRPCDLFFLGRGAVKVPLLETRIAKTLNVLCKGAATVPYEKRNNDHVTCKQMFFLAGVL